MIGIVIPFYQKQAGLLRRALLSVESQHEKSGWRIYVVDDGSPSPIEGELRGLPVSLTRRIQILRQGNAGPGAARNRALNALPAGVSIVAFLDSDDIWHSGHLGNIRDAFAAGADFYFSDHRREEDKETRFTQCAFRPDGSRIENCNANSFWCDSSALFRATILRSPVGTSTVALRRSRIGTRRFLPGFRAAGEDSIFWLEILAEGARVACNRDNEVLYGRGVSIFNHRSWGDARSLRTTLDQMRAQLYLRNNFPLDDTLLAESDARCRDLDLAFCSAVMACGRRLQWAATAPAIAYARTRPMALAQLPRALFRALQPQHERTAS